MNMGLDSGLLIKPKTVAGGIFLAENFGYCQDEYLSGVIPVYEFAYFRKCWNIRHAMLITGLAADADDYELKIADLEKVVLIMKYFLDENHWDTSESIWEWYVQVPAIADTIKKIRLFLDYLDGEDLDDRDFSIVWYDSY
jgi:hypothetical protein